MATLEDVAALAGVSRSTASRVANHDANVRARTRDKVNQAITTLGYSPNFAARALASSCSNTLGLVTTSYRGGFFGAMMACIQEEAESQGKQLLVTQGRHNAEKEWEAIQRLFNLHCDGLILHVRWVSDQQLCQLANEQRHFVLLDRDVAGLEDRCIPFDHTFASRLATQQLLDVGHRHIACITGSQQRLSSRLRLQGFLDAMQAAAIAPLACLEGAYDIDSGFRLTDTLLSSAQRPTAIYCCSEEMALGTLLAISEHRLRVPQDISLICYDSGERAPFVRPALTCVDFPITEMARHAARRLIDPQTTVIPFTPRIIQRHSIAPPAK